MLTLCVTQLYGSVLQIEELERKAAQETGEQREQQLERKGHLCTQLVSVLRMDDERWAILVLFHRDPDAFCKYGHHVGTV